MAEPLSILDKIIESEKYKQLLTLDLEAEVEFLLSNPKIKKDRDKEVLIARYGLGGNKPKTLEEIGQSINVTRERVRQIEKAALKKTKDFAEKEKRAQKINALIHELVKKNGGVATLEQLNCLVLNNTSNNLKLKNILHFVTYLNKYLVQIDENKELKSGVATVEFDLKCGLKAIEKAIAVLEKKNVPVSERELIKELQKEGVTLENETVISVLELSKKIMKTEEGHFGLIHWRDINPKSIRDKTYYVLRKHKKPLHFSEISKNIEDLNNGKSVTKQAVHNELIRDERFVLIGRGIYALKEWGYSEGFVEDVIEDVLAEAGKPLHKDEIIQEVLKKRIVKETTILLNLQKGKFTRVARATYTLKDGNSNS
jgi:DNA-directed RNA polymerase delta subunit